jgi:hypothetical protein
MKMKMNKKNINRLLRVAQKNYLIFTRHIVSSKRFDKGFRGDLTKMVEKYNPSLRPQIVEDGFMLFADEPSYFENNIENYNTAGKCLRELPSETLNQFYEDLKGFQKKYDLGLEWRLPIMTLIFTGFFHPPVRNFHIMEVEPSGGAERFAIVVNDDISIEDLTIALSDVKSEIVLRKKSDPKKSIGKMNVTSHALENLQYLAFVDALKTVYADLGNWEQLTDYEKIQYAQFVRNGKSIAEFKKFIRGNRQKRKNSGERISKKSLRWRKSESVSTVLQTMRKKAGKKALTKIEIQKKANRIAQLRRRHKI